MRLVVLRVLFIGGLLAIFAGQANLFASDFDGEELYKRAINSCVFIVANDSRTGDVWSGSGTLVDAKKRLVLTNYHVVGKLQYVYVMFPMFDRRGEMLTDRAEYKKIIEDGKAIKAKVLCSSTEKDLALIELESLTKEAKSIPIANKSPGPGAAIHSIGNPGASKLLWVYTPGSVRQIGVENYMIGNPRTPIGRFEINCKIINTNSLVNPGDSGGPLLNKNGELVGVTHAGSKDDSISKFIDISEVYTFLRENKITLTNEYHMATRPSTPPKETLPMESKETPKSEPIQTPKSEPKDPPKIQPSTPVVSDEERRAELMLKVAKSLNNEGQKRDKLLDIIRVFPNSSAAKEAKKILATLKD